LAINANDYIVYQVDNTGAAGSTLFTFSFTCQ